MIMKPVWVTVVARPAVGFLAREVRAEMTVLSASTAAAASGTGWVRQDKEGSACAGRRLPGANEGGPDGELTRSSKTTRPATPSHTSACSRWSSPGTRTAGQRVLLLSASGPEAAACCARRTQRGPRRPTTLECTNFARRIQRCGSQPAAPAAGPDQRVPVNPVPRCKLRQWGGCPHPLSRHADDPRPQISRDTRSRDPPTAAVAPLAARGASAIRRTMPLTPARAIVPGHSR
jgi:hypothetical protein